MPTREELNRLEKDQLINLILSFFDKLQEMNDKVKMVNKSDVKAPSQKVQVIKEGLDKMYGGKDYQRRVFDEEYVRVLSEKSKHIGPSNNKYLLGHDIPFQGNFYDAILHYWKHFEGPGYKGSIFDYADENFIGREESPDDRILEAVVNIVISSNLIQLIE